MNKAQLRKHMLELRRKLTLEEREKKSRKIYQTLIRLKQIKNAEKILIYLSLKHEVDTRQLVKTWQTEKELIAPRINPKSETLELRKLIPLDTLKNHHGIHEPQQNHQTYHPSKVDIAIIPGVAFDIKGNRLGFGKGYYDKLLKKLNCTTIGLAFECQIVDKLPLDAHDHPVDMIITEKRVIKRFK